MPIVKASAFQMPDRQKRVETVSCPDPEAAAYVTKHLSELDNTHSRLESAVNRSGIRFNERVTKLPPDPGKQKFRTRPARGFVRNRGDS